MSEAQDRIMDVALGEVISGGPAQDLAARVLEAAEREDLLDPVDHAGDYSDLPSYRPLPGRIPAPEPESAIRVGEGVVIQLPRGQTRPWFERVAIAAVAACVLFAIGFMVFTWPAPEERPLPERVVASADAEYRVLDGSPELKSGWFLVREGAPAVRAGSVRVDKVEGLIFVSLGSELPSDDQMNAISEQVSQDGSLNTQELEMLKDAKNWVVRGGIVVCLIAGGAMLNDSYVEGQTSLKKKAEAKATDKAAGDAKAEKKAKKRAIAALKKKVVETESDVAEVYKKVSRRKMSNKEALEKYRAKQVKAAEVKAAELKKKVDKKVNDVFKKIDTNGDDVVSGAEAKKALGGEADKWVKKLDKNKDGSVSRAEADEHYKKATVEEEKVKLKKRWGRSGIGIGGGATGESGGNVRGRTTLKKSSAGGSDGPVEGSDSDVKDRKIVKKRYDKKNDAKDSTNGDKEISKNTDGTKKSTDGTKK